MTEITLKGKPIHTTGKLPKVGKKAPDFLLIDSFLHERSLKDFAGKRKILSIVPSLDTPVCLTSAKKFNEQASSIKNLVVIYISADLPFAQKRACDTENLKHIKTLSMMRDREFAKDYGVLIKDGPLQGISARALIVLDEDDVVQHVELVPEIAQEPNYGAAFSSIS